MLKIALSQLSPYLADLDKNAWKHFNNIEAAISSKCNVIVFPELSISGYDLRDAVPDVALNFESDIFMKLTEYSNYISILFGFVYEEEPGRYFNAAAYLEDGEIKHIHKKVYLPSYGMFDEKRYFTEGDSFSLFYTKYFKGSILICEDALHVSALSKIAPDSPEVIFVLSNSPIRGINKISTNAEDMWYSTCKYISTTILSNVVFINRTGVEEGVSFWGKSAVFESGGIMNVQLPFMEEELCTARISMSSIREARIKNPLINQEK